MIYSGFELVQIFGTGRAIIKCTQRGPRGPKNLIGFHFEMLIIFLRMRSSTWWQWGCPTSPLWSLPWWLRGHLRISSEVKRTIHCTNYGTPHTLPTFCAIQSRTTAQAYCAGHIRALWCSVPHRLAASEGVMGVRRQARDVPDANYHHTTLHSTAMSRNLVNCPLHCPIM